MTKRSAVFLDRDGTVNKEVHYLSDPDQLELLPTVAQTIAQLNSAEIAVVVVTNQAGVARGYFPESRLDAVHIRLKEMLNAFNARVDGIYYCPHHPVEGLGEYRLACECRKPLPGMLSQAARDLDLDLTRSLMIGDRDSDLQAGFNAGCQTALVRTGYGEATSKTLDLQSVRGLGVFSTVAEAVEAWQKVIGRSVQSPILEAGDVD